MVNCNPETVSTDYDTIDRLYFEPLTFEDVMAVLDKRAKRRRGGVMPGAVRRADAAQAGAAAAGRRRADHRHLARLDRPGGGPRAVLEAAAGTCGIPQPASGTATSRAEAREVAATIGFPVVVRPSYVLGGRAMAIVYDVATLDRYMAGAVDASHERPVLDRPVPRGRLRARRGRVGRRAPARRHRRRHGAHRGGRHPLGRQLVRRAALSGRRAAPGDDSRLHPAHRARAEGRRADERAVRHQGRRRSTCSR